MKSLRFYILAILGLAAGFSSCMKDLDVTPNDPSIVTTDKVFSTIQGFQSALGKLYSSYAVSGQQGPSGNPDIAGIDEGFSNYLRQYFNLQELSTDEAVLSWNDQTIKNYHWQTWTSSDVFNFALYSRIYYTIAVANEYIRDAQAYIGKLSSTDQTTAQEYIAEARFVRALSYYHAIDLYGNPPYITENDKPSAFFPKQIKRADLFTYIESELKAIETVLPAPGTAPYGHADQGAAWALLARLYLNSTVYLKTPGGTTNNGTARWTDCITYCNKIIQSSAYTLNPVYQNNFTADNNTSKEIIFAINFDSQNTTSYGGTDYIIHAQVGGAMNPAHFGVAGGWAGLRTTKALVNLFPNVDPVTGTSVDMRAMFYTNGQSLEIADIGTFSNGYAVQKFTGLNSDGSRPQPPVDFVSTDFPVFRLADVYLMYAESVINGGTGGDINTAVGYINQLRDRAYGNTSGEISAGDVTSQFILNERGRELYWECVRRTDLIRFGQFTNGTYVWPWKGNVAQGTQTAAFRDLYPIPVQDIINNPSLTQNTGY